jgi:tetratricopeptide (TPR) repeat protein
MAIWEKILEGLVNIAMDKALGEAEGGAWSVIERARLEFQVKKAFRNAYNNALRSFPRLTAWPLDPEFIERPAVRAELRKLSGPFSSPNVERLVEEWIAVYGPTSEQDLSEALGALIREAQGELRDIVGLSKSLSQKAILERAEANGESLSRIETMVSALGPSSGSGEPTAEAAGRYSAQLDIVKRLIDQNQPQAAITQLETLWAERTRANIPDAVAARLQMLLGAARLVLGDTSAAAKHFVRAHDLAPDDAKTKAHRAFAHLLQGEYGDAAALADAVLAEHPDGTSARAVRTWALAEVRRYRDLYDLVNEDYLHDTLYLQALSMVFLEEGRYDEAERYLRTCIARNEMDVGSRLRLVRTLVERSIPAVEFTMYAERVVESSQQIKEALRIADEAVKIARDGDNSALLAEVLVSRADIHAHLGEAAKAEADLQRALDVAPDQPSVLFNYGLHAMNQGNFSTALEYLSKIPLSLDPAIPLRTALAQCYVATNQPERALAILPGDGQEPLAQALFKVRALAQLGRSDEARAIITRVLSGDPDAKALRIAAFMCSALDDDNRAIDTLIRAHAIADASLQNQIAVDLGMLLLQERRFSEAVQWFGRAEEVVLSRMELTQNYVLALYQANHYREAYQCAAKARERGTASRLTIAIEAFIAEALGDLASAETRYRELIADQPDVTLHRINLMRVLIRCGNVEAVNAVLEEVDVDKVKEALDFLQLGEINALLGRPWEGLNIAHRGLLAGRDIPEVHLGYIHLFFSHDHELACLRPSEVRADSAVLIKQGDQQRWIKLLSTRKGTDPTEHTADSEIGGRLLGRHVGDVVALNPGAIDEHECTILDIQDIRVRSLQESLEEYQLRFPSDRSLQSISADERGINKMLIATAQFSERAETILKVYSEGYLTLEALAELLGHDAVEVQTGLADTEGQVLRVSLASEEENQETNRALRNTAEITLSLSAMVTLQRLGLLDCLAQRFSTLNIPQQLVDILFRLHQEKKQWLQKQRGSLVYGNGGWRLVELSEEASQREIRVYEQLFEFAKRNCRAIPLSFQYADMVSRQSKRTRAVGPVTLATVLVAEQRGTPVYADDLVLRLVARGEHKVASFCTLDLLTDLHRCELITADQAAQGRLRLALDGYIASTIDAFMLIQSLDDTVCTRRQATRAIGLLAQPSVSPVAVVAIAAQFVRTLWLMSDPICLFSRDWALDMILMTLAGRPAGIVLIEQLRHELKKRFRVAPVQQAEVDARIQAWLQYWHP